ncbi:hypothetical protein B5E88_07925 [Enterococcus cecorum]|uniref:Transposase n=2 Tax=Enterococcus cecorum TaxID=44008 RepID=A0A1Y4QXB8_9ENTE|nr:hypothetical protein B5E88_07925 [Enterococcus cecorum]
MNMIWICMMTRYSYFAVENQIVPNHFYWDGDGFILLYKRINDGKLKWPRKSEEIMKLSNQYCQIINKIFY